MIQKEFAATKKAEVMDPILTSPFPRWTTNWQSQSVGRELFGVVLPTMETIKNTGFVCNVWDRHWIQAQSDDLVTWAAEGSGESPSSSLRPEPDSELPREQIAALVAASVPTLTSVGVPVVIALRTVAAALLALGYKRSTMACMYPRESSRWSVQQWVGVYLLGALKSEWGDQGESSGVTSFHACHAELKAQLAPDTTTKDMDLAFMDARFNLIVDRLY